MAKAAIIIFTLNHEEAMDFFIKSEQYHGLIDMVYNKLCNQPNSDNNQLWLQNMTYIQDKKKETSLYSQRFCQLVASKKVQPCNNECLKVEFVQNMPTESIVDKKSLKKMAPIITFRGTGMYAEL